MFYVNPLPLKRIHMKYQVLFSLKNNEEIFMNVVCCSCDWHFKGFILCNLKQNIRTRAGGQKRNSHIIIPTARAAS